MSDSENPFAGGGKNSPPADRATFTAWAVAVGQGAATERKHRRELAALGLPSSAAALIAPDLAAVPAAASSAWDRLPSNKEIFRAR